MTLAALLPIAALVIWSSAVAIAVGAVSMSAASISTTKRLMEGLITLRQQTTLAAETRQTELLEQLSTLARTLDQSQVRIADVLQLFEELRLEHQQLTTAVEHLDNQLRFQYEELSRTIVSMHSHITGKSLTDV